MGLLTKGTPLSWAETVPFVEYIKVSHCFLFRSFSYHFVNHFFCISATWNCTIHCSLPSLEDARGRSAPLGRWDRWAKRQRDPILTLLLQNIRLLNLIIHPRRSELPFVPMIFLSGFKPKWKLTTLWGMKTVPNGFRNSLHIWLKVGHALTNNPKSSHPIRTV